jgi:hypothetical protein
MACDPRDKRDQRWLIDVAGAKMFGTGEVIEFVAENSVAVRDQEMEDKLRGREGKDDGGTERTAATVCIFSVAHESTSRSGDLEIADQEQRRFVNRRSLMIDLHPHQSPLRRMLIVAGVFPGRYIEAP